MIEIILSLIVGWIFNFAGLDTLFEHWMGFTSHQYYLLWFFYGAIVWMNNLRKQK